ncbi:MAG: YceI family protein [Bacteroidales bacterium]|nr:YceI family protein [Bacteroidales bacterium]
MKNKNILFLFIFLGFAMNISAQKLISKNGHIRFYSHTPVEDIEANNFQVVSILDPETGSVQFTLLIKSFEFQKKLMQEHFNENYMESDEYPKASFTGQINNLSEINFEKDGNYSAKVSGDLTIHGVTKKINTPGTIIVSKDKVTATAVLIVLPEDYNITIPDVVKEKIAKEVEVTIDVSYNKN